AARRQGAAERADRRPRHHDPARARRARPRSGPAFGHALGVAVRRSADRCGRERRAMDARPDARRRRDGAQRAGARQRHGDRAARGGGAAAARGARRVRGARPRSAAHCERRPDAGDRRGRGRGARARRVPRRAGRRRRVLHRRGARRARRLGDRRDAVRRHARDRHAGRRPAAAHMLSMQSVASLAARVAARLRARNDVLRAFFDAEAPRLARASQEAAERFARGGGLYAFGNGPYATDAAHVSVEFIHPVIVGKRALPAMDASAAPEAFVEALVGPDDIAIAFGPPEGDLRTIAALRRARRRGAYTLAWPGIEADYSVTSPTADTHVHQEAFEVLGHTLYESVHVFLEHRREMGDDVGASAFLYPYLGSAQPDAGAIVDGVAAAIVEKARDGERLRDETAAGQSETIAAAVVAMGQRIARGGRLLVFGNGG